MLKKYVMLILAMLAFLSLASFAQDTEAPTTKKNEEITQIEEAASKLSKNMTVDEVKQLLDEPAGADAGYYSTNLTFLTYLFSGKEYLILRFVDDKLTEALDKNDSDLLLTEYMAKVADFSILVNNEEMPVSNPILTVNGNIYFSITELSELLEISVSFNNEKQRLEFATDVPINLGFMTKRIPEEVDRIPDYISTIVPITRAEKNKGITQMKEATDKLSIGMTIEKVEQLLGKPTRAIGSGIYGTLYEFAGGEMLILTYFDRLDTISNKGGFDLSLKEYKATVEEFPVFVDGKEIVILNPVVTIDKMRYATAQHLAKTYVPIEDLAEQLGIMVTFNEEKQLLEIATIK